MVISKLWSQLRKFIYFQTTKEGVKLRGANVGKKCNKFFSDLRGTSVSMVSKDKRLFSLNAWMGQINRIKINYDAKLILSVHTHWTLFQIGPNTPYHFPFLFYRVCNKTVIFLFLEVYDSSQEKELTIDIDGYNLSFLLISKCIKTFIGTSI